MGGGTGSGGDENHWIRGWNLLDLSPEEFARLLVTLNGPYDWAKERDFVGVKPLVQ